MGGNPKRVSINSEQINLGLFTKQADHDYCRISSGDIECRSRCSVSVSQEFERVEAKNRNFSKDCKSQGGGAVMDLFASRLSRQVPSYLSWKVDPSSQGRDAFQHCWTHLEGYAFPPFCLIGRVLQKVQLDQATLLMITPTWQSQSWYLRLLQLSI